MITITRIRGDKQPHFLLVDPSSFAPLRSERTTATKLTIGLKVQHKRKDQPKPIFLLEHAKEIISVNTKDANPIIMVRKKVSSLLIDII